MSKSIWLQSETIDTFRWLTVLHNNTWTEKVIFSPNLPFFQISYSVLTKDLDRMSKMLFIKFCLCFQLFAIRTPSLCVIATTHIEGSTTSKFTERGTSLQRSFVIMRSLVIYKVQSPNYFALYIQTSTFTFCLYRISVSSTSNIP